MESIPDTIRSANNKIIKLLKSDKPLWTNKKDKLKQLLKYHLDFLKNNIPITYESLEEIEKIKQYRFDYIQDSEEIMNDEDYKYIYTNMCSVKVTIMRLIHIPIIKTFNS